MPLMDQYWALASNNADERIAAAETLLRGLQDKNNESDWDYALKRLVRGLSSSRGSARLGFSMALAELLQLRSADISIKEYLSLCDIFFEISSGMKGNEERGLLFGRLFALKILAESSLWDTSSRPSDDLSAFVRMTMDLALKKAWLREPPFSALCELIRKLSSKEEFENGIELAFALHQERGLSMSCEGVALALSIPRDQRHRYNSSSGWFKGDPMDRESLHLLSRTLREMPVSSGDVSQSKPYIHFVWSYILTEYLHASNQRPDHYEAEVPPAKKAKLSKKSVNIIPLKDFWNSAVDHDFFGPDTSSERKMWGFEIFLLWCQEPSFPDVEMLLSPNLIKTLSSQLSQKDKTLNKMAKKVAAVITQTAVELHSDRIVPMISQFMMYSPNFDKTSKSKLVQSLLSSVKDPRDISDLVDILISQVNSLSIKDLVRRQWIFDNLVQLVKISNQRKCFNETKATRSDTWVTKILETLIPQAYFVETKKAATISEDDQDRIAKIAQDRVLSILSSTLGNKVNSIRQDPQSSWPYIVFQLIMNFRNEHPTYEPRVEFDDETLKAKTKAETTLYKIHKKRNSSRHVDSSQLQAFELLFAMVLLQVYGCVPDAISMLDELQMCYYKIKGKRRALDEGEDSDPEQEEEPSLVLTEILISLLSQHSAVLRKLSEDVWRAFSGQLTEKSLSLLCDICSAQEGTQGQKFLFDVEVDSHNEHEDADQSQDVEEDGLEESSDMEINESENASSDYELDDDSKKRLARTLGVTASDNVDKDGSIASSEEDSMDDEQMSALDGHLAIIFRERRKLQTKAKEKRLENLKAKQNIVHLKGRVLDLLDIYLIEEPENLQGLVCVEPLLNLIQSTKDPKLGEKARELIKNRLCRKTKYKLARQEDCNFCLEMIQKIHRLASKSKSKMHTLACNQVSVFLSKLVIAFDPKLVTDVSNVYCQSLQSWFLNPTDQATANMFIDFINFLDTKRSAQ